MSAAAVSLLAVTLLGFQPEPPDIVSSLITALREADVEIRSNTAAALSVIGAPSVEPLKKMLTDRDSVARAGAAYALGQLGVQASSAKSELLVALKDENRDVRRQASYALSRLLNAEREQPLSVPALPPPPVFPGKANVP